jgi:hypothetical protein
MFRKQIIKRKVRKLTPREINYIVSAVTFYDEEHGGEYSNPHEYEDIMHNIQGRCKHLAIIVEE